MPKSQYQHSITVVLLSTLLFKNCQSKLDILQEEELPTEKIAEIGANQELPSALSSPALSASNKSTIAIATNTHRTPKTTPLPTNSSSTQVSDIARSLSSRVFTASSGENVKFNRVNGQWSAELQSTSNTQAPQRTLRVVSTATIGPQLAWLQGQDPRVSRARIHVLSTSQPPYQGCVYLGKVGLLGGMVNENEDSKLLAQDKQNIERGTAPATPETHASEKPLYDVFISHVGEDKESIAIPLYDELTLLGIYPFLDKKEFRTSKYIPNDMIQAMETARCGIFILSPEFVAREWPMKELRCFLHRYQDAKNKGHTPPLLVPVFHRLTPSDCRMTPQAFFSKYESHFAAERNDFLRRIVAKETTIEQTMEDLQALQQLECLPEVERKEHDYRLIHKVAQTVHEEAKKWGAMGLNPSEAPTSRLHDHIDFPEVVYYMSRSQETQLIYKGLAETGICVVHGSGGSGKSTLALHYAKNYNEDQSVVQFIPIGSVAGKNALIEEFQRIAQELGKDWRTLARHHRGNPREYHKALGALIYRTLAEKDQRIFLILDDAQQQHTKTIKDLLLYRDWDRVKVLITTRDQQAFQGQYSEVLLADFSAHEGRAYVSQQLQVIGREDHVYDVNTLLKVVGRMPIRLELAIHYLDMHATVTPSEYTQELQKMQPTPGEMSQVAMGLEGLAVLSQQVMRYSTLLDATSIPLALLSSLIEQNQERLEAVLESLVRLSLIKLLPDSQSIQIHPKVQDSCQHYRGWSEAISTSEITLLERLASVLEEKMPWVTSKADARWEAGRIYAPHISKVLSKATAVLAESPAIASLLYLMGNYQMKVACGYQQACTYFEKGLEMRQRLYNNTPHPDIAKSLTSMGIAYETLEDITKGFPHQKQALTMRQQLYGKTPHPHVANSLYNMSRLYQALNEFQKSLAYKEQALAVYQALYGEEPHPYLAICLSSIGIAYYEELGNVKKGLPYQEQALEMRRKLYGKTPNLDLACSINNVGLAYQKLGDVQNGLKYQEEALIMRQQLYGETPHAHIACSLNNIGVAYQALGDVRKGLSYQEKALAMRQQLYGDVPHPHMASSFNNLGSAYQNLGDVRKGLIYFEQALALYKTLHREELHSNLAVALTNVGLAYHQLGDAQKGLIYLKQALDIHQKLHGDTPHSDTASSLNSIGAAYEALGDIRQGFNYKEQALMMRQQLYGDKTPHPDIAGSLNNIGSAYEVLGDVQKELLYKEQALTMYRSLYGDTPHPDLATSLSNVGIAYENLKELQKSLRYQEEALVMRQQLYGDTLHPSVADSLNSVGVVYEALGDAQKGLAYQERALAMCKTLYGDTPNPYTAVCLNSLSITYENLGDTKKGIEYKEQVLAVYQALYGDTPRPDVASTLNNMGVAYDTLGDIRKGLMYKEKALEMHQTLHGETPHPDVALSLNNVGTAYERLGELQKGLEYREQALAVRQQLYGKVPHPDVASSLNNVGVAYENLGDVQKGLAYQEQALEIYRVLYGEEPNLNVAHSLNNVGTAYYQLNEVQKGLSYQEKALAMYQALHGEEPHSNVANSLNSVGSAYEVLGDVPKGLIYRKQALEVRKQLYGETLHPDVANSLKNVGMAYQKLNEVQQGLQYQEKALAMYQALHGEEPHPNVANCLHNVGSAYQELGEVGKSLTYLEQALKIRQELHGEEPHPDVASSLHCIGTVYEALGEAQEGHNYKKQALMMRKKLYDETSSP